MRKRLFDLVVMRFCLLLQGYFGWHYLYGSRSSATLEAIEEEARAIGGRARRAKLPFARPSRRKLRS